MKFRNAILILLITLWSGFLTGCVSSTIPNQDPSASYISLEEMQATVAYPEKWKLLNDEYFQVKAVGLAPNGNPSFLEYRGLHRDQSTEPNPDLYAEGWYEAIKSSYPEWKYISKGRIQGTNYPVFHFEGTFRVAADTFRKMGKLYILKNRIHAIYYTSLDNEFEEARSMFLNLDELQEFEEPSE